MNAARSRASDARSTSRSVPAGAGGQSAGPSPAIADNLTHLRENDLNDLEEQG
ncbi:hypothetical protein GCM10010274_52720 [Streptomyces lavendofoliae]|uniref:Uncharacterized protein n=1 Tax=Streptomyces lavendofoliae TaxID=67314 RepID=A0A918M6H5_9ACTN|nr:hypothetical protein GCM10010274_52720 [Streptomyces lavendofoliae]